MKQFTNILFGVTAFKGYLSIADRLIYSGTNFLTIVVVGRVCGLDSLGVFVLAWTVLLATNVIQEALVLSPFTVFVGRFTDEKIQRTCAGTALILQMCLAAMATVILLVTAIIMTYSSGDSVALVACWFLLIAVPAVSMREFVRRYLLAKLAARQVLALDAIVSCIQLGGIASFWYWDLLTPGLTLMLIGLAAGLPAIIWLMLHSSYFDIAERNILAAEAWNHWSFGRWICASQVSDLAVAHGVVWLIAGIAGTAATGIFAVCNSIVLIVNPLLFGIGNILLPRAAQANHLHGRSEVNRIVWKVTAILMFTVGVLGFLVAFHGEFLIGTFYKLESLDGVQEIVILLALANFFGAAGFAINNGLLVVNRPDVNLAASAVGLVVTLCLAILLTPEFGAIGTAFSVMIGTLLNALYHIVAFMRLVGMPAILADRRTGPGK